MLQHSVILTTEVIDLGTRTLLYSNSASLHAILHITSCNSIFIWGRFVAIGMNLTQKVC